MVLWNLFLAFFKIGALSFGGGYSMIPFFEREIAANHWTAASDYPKMIAIAQVFPGPFAIDSSAYIGYKVAGIAGAVVASLALSLPAFIALILISKYQTQFKHNKYLAFGLIGVRPVVIALLITAAFIIGLKPLARLNENILSSVWLKAVLAITTGYFCLLKTRLNPLLFISLFALLGILFF